MCHTFEYAYTRTLRCALAIAVYANHRTRGRAPDVWFCLEKIEIALGFWGVSDEPLPKFLEGSGAGYPPSGSKPLKGSLISKGFNPRPVAVFRKTDSSEIA